MSRLLLTYDRNGYEAVFHYDECGKTTRVAVHQLCAIAGGADSHDVFADGMNVHHVNGMVWDNRPENLAVMASRDHSSLHKKRYSDEDLISWLQAYYDVFEYPPTKSDMNASPGPSGSVYTQRFGSYAKALEAAGLPIRPVPGQYL